MAGRCTTFQMSLAMSLVMVVGCGSQSSHHQEVSGKVMVNGYPAARAKLFFSPLDDSKIRPFALIEEDGSFRMTGKDGAPVGEYAVTVIWPTYEINGGEEIEIGDRLNGRYADPINPFVKVTIQKGKNDLPPFLLLFP